MSQVEFEDCNVCGEHHDTALCPLLEMVEKVEDKHIPSRARLTLPNNLMLLENGNKILSVATKEAISAGIQFGPLEAPLVQELQSQPRFLLKIFNKDGTSLFVDTTDENRCNWMCLVSPAADEESQNLISYQLNSDIYFSTKRRLVAGEELLVGYSPPYGRKMLASVKVQNDQASLNQEQTDLMEEPQLDVKQEGVTWMSSVAEDSPIKWKQGQQPLDLATENPSQVPVLEELPPVEEDIIRMLGAHELGVEEQLQEWQCSQCLESYTNCLDFARHLQQHYKPIGSGKCGWRRARGRGGRGRGRRRGRGRGRARGWWAVRGGGRAWASKGLQSEDEGPWSGDSLGGMTSSYGADHPMVTESGNRDVEDTLASQQSLEAINVEDRLASSSLLDSDTPDVIVSSPLPPGRKRKGALTETEGITTDKHYRAINRMTSVAATGKYNLRTVRKALVTSEDEIEGDEDDDDGLYNSSWYDGWQGGSGYDTHNNNSQEEKPRTVYVVTIRKAESPLATDVDATASCKEILCSPSDEPPATSASDKQPVQPVYEAQPELPVGTTDTNVTTLEITVEHGVREDGAIVDLTPEQSEIACISDATVEPLSRKQGEKCIGEIVESPKNAARSLGLPLQFRRSRRPGKYTCDLCGKGFDKMLYLYRHIRKHTGEFTCVRCHKAFARKENMLKHNCPGVADADKESPFEFTCWYCDKAFATDRLLHRHLVRHTGEFRFTCSDCGKSYATKEILLNHVCTRQPEEEQFACRVCGKSFTKEMYLIKHMPVHTGQHSCPICGKWLRSLDSLTNHMRMCSQVKEISLHGKASCPSCHEEFTDVMEFRRHQYEHTHLHACETCGARFRNKVSLNLHACQGYIVSCDVCGKSFSNATSMQRHKQMHGEPQHKCSTCGKSYYRKESLMSHVCEKGSKVTPSQERKKKPPSLMPLICEICGSMFSSTSSLNVHRNLHGEKKFECEICNKKFHRKDLWLEHHSVHGAPSFPCPTCSKMFKTKKSLDVHVLIHDGIKRFKCSFCGKAFFQKGNLQKHEETHNKSRKYTCTICQKSFSTKDYLGVHMLEHTRGRIYDCGICRRSFVKEHQLKSHHKLFHSSQSYRCKYCGLSLKLRHSLKRHLRKKHGDYEEEWKKMDVVNGMLTMKDVPPEEMEVRGTTELQLVPDLTNTQGAEVLLAVAGIGSQELQEAIASGRAQIKQGPTPNTIEISVPVSCESTNEQGDDVSEGSRQIVLASLTTDGNVGDVPVSCDEVLQRQVATDENRASLDDASMREVMVDGISMSAVTTEALEEQYRIEVPLQQSTLEDLEQLDTQNNEIVCMAEQLARDFDGRRQLMAQIADGKHIMVSGQDLGDGTHHIVLNAEDLQVESNENTQTTTDGAIVLEDGTILQHTEGDGQATDLLLYVLTSNEQTT